MADPDDGCGGPLAAQFAAPRGRPQGGEPATEQRARELVAGMGLPRGRVEEMLERQGQWSRPRPRLTGAQTTDLRAAVEGAFTPVELQRVLAADMRVGLWTVSGAKRLPELTSDVIAWAEARGRTHEFLAAIARAKPGRGDIRRLPAAISGG